MLACSRVKNLLASYHFCLVSCVAEFYISVFTSMNIHVSTDDENVVFGNVSGKGREVIEDRDDIRFIAGIGGTLVEDDCRAEVVIKSKT